MRILEIMKKNNIIILFFLTLICMTVGFAVYNQQLNMSGSVSLVPGGRIEITSVVKGTHTNATSDPQIIDDNTAIDFNLSFTTIRSSSATYVASFDITIANNTFDDWVFNMPDYKLEIGVDGTDYTEEYSAYAGWKITNAEIGDKIPAKSEKTFTMTFTFSNPEENSYGVTYEINGNFTPKITRDDEATLMGSVADSATADLTGINEKAVCTMKVISTYSTDKTFTISVKNTDKFAVQLLDDVDYTIAANSEAVFEFYLTKVDGAEYPYTSTNVDIVLESQGTTYSTGSVAVKVDQDITIDDTTAPTISNVTATIGDTENTAQLTWDATDDVTIEYFTIYAYKLNEDTYEKVSEVQTSDASKSILLTDLEEGTYYFVVTGTDNSNNTATEDEIANATTSEGTASRSEDIELKWNFSVTINATNVSYTGDTGENAVKRGETYTVTFTASSEIYKIPENLDDCVTMGGVIITNFSYDSTTGVLNIPSVTGDIEITATGIFNFICLAEGTQILLADGTYKNIEDVEYTDLLAVYDHLNGGITYVYPVWIERAGGVASSYEKITFDDGSFIKVVGQHCLFDCEQNKYVDVSNTEEFAIGSKVYKIEDDELKIVTVTNIEYINEEVKYYDVLSTTHYNVIANNLITTDKITQLANILYGFDENAVFAKFDEVSNSKQIEYKDASFFPYNIFKGCNFNNTLSLAENGYVDLRDLAEFLVTVGKEQITRNGDKYYMVTTSVDEVDSTNTDNYLYKEGSTYTFPKIGAKYFIDTSTNKKYKEGETFIVYNSTHFKVEY